MQFLKKILISELILLFMYTYTEIDFLAKQSSHKQRFKIPFVILCFSKEQTQGLDQATYIHTALLKCPLMPERSLPWMSLAEAD